MFNLKKLLMILFINVIFANKLIAINMNEINSIKNTLIKGAFFHYILYKLGQKSRQYEEYAIKLMDSLNPLDERIETLRLSCIDNPYFIFHQSWLKIIDITQTKSDKIMLDSSIENIGEKHLFFSKLLNESRLFFAIACLYFCDFK